MTGAITVVVDGTGETVVPLRQGVSLHTLRRAAAKLYGLPETHTAHIALYLDTAVVDGKCVKATTCMGGGCTTPSAPSSMPITNGTEGPATGAAHGHVSSPRRLTGGERVYAQLEARDEATGEASWGAVIALAMGRDALVLPVAEDATVADLKHVIAARFNTDDECVEIRSGGTLLPNDTVRLARLGFKRCGAIVWVEIGRPHAEVAREKLADRRLPPSIIAFHQQVEKQWGLPTRFRDWRAVEWMIATGALPGEALQQTLLDAVDDPDSLKTLLNAAARQRREIKRHPSAAANARQEPASCASVTTSAGGGSSAATSGGSGSPVDCPYVRMRHARRGGPVHNHIDPTSSPSGRDGTWADPTAAMQEAIRYGCAASIALLAHHGADVNTTSDDGTTPLMWAVTRRDESLALALIGRGADVNESDRGGMTPLMHAVVAAMHNTVDAILRCCVNVDVDMQDFCGWTALMFAAQAGEQQAAAALAARGADVNAQSTDGFTPLLLAAEHGHIGVAEVLLNWGADVNLADKAGRRPIACVGLRRHIPRADRRRLERLLLRYGATRSVWGVVRALLFPSRAPRVGEFDMDIPLRGGGARVCVDRGRTRGAEEPLPSPIRRTARRFGSRCIVKHRKKSQPVFEGCDVFQAPPPPRPFTPDPPPNGGAAELLDGIGASSAPTFSMVLSP